MLDLPLFNERPTLQVTRAGHQVSIAEAIANRGGAIRGAVRALDVASGETLLGCRKQQITLLHTVA